MNAKKNMIERERKIRRKKVWIKNVQNSILFHLNNFLFQWQPCTVRLYVWDTCAELYGICVYLLYQYHFCIFFYLWGGCV